MESSTESLPSLARSRSGTDWLGPHAVTQRSSTVLARSGFALVTAALLLAEIALTRVFSGTIGYYFAFMSISVAMLGLGAGSLWITLRGRVTTPPYTRAGRAAFALALAGAASMLVYLRYYPFMGAGGFIGQAAYLGIFGALFLPFLFGGVLIAIVFESNHASFGTLYAIDLIGAAVGCVVAVFLLDRVPAPIAMILISALAGIASPLFFLASGAKRHGILAGILLIAIFGGGALAFRGSPLFAARIIRNKEVKDLVEDRWNNFSRVVVRKGPFYTWGLSDTYTTKHDPQYDLLIEGVAGTQIQKFDGTNIKSLDFFPYDIASLPHLLRPSGSTLVLGVGAGFDVMMAKYFDKSPIVGVEVNPLVGEIVNEDFAAYSGRPYLLSGMDVHFENARTFVKRDTAHYDIVTVTWVDSGAATGAGAFALTENYLYTVEAFRDYLDRLKDDGVLAFMRARHSPEYDAIKGIGIAVEAMRQLGVSEPEKNIVVSSVKSPHFGYRELTHVMLRKRPFSQNELDVIESARNRLHFNNLYTPERTDGDADIARLITDKNRQATYDSFPFDMEPNTDDRPFYFFLRSIRGHSAGGDVLILRQSLVTIFLLIAAFLILPLIALVRRGVQSPSGLIAPTAYFSLLGLGFMLIEMKILQQSVLIVGNPTLSLAAVLSSLLVSSGLGALCSKYFAQQKSRGVLLFTALLCVLVLALFLSEPLATLLTGFPLPIRTFGLMLSIAPLGFLLGCPLPLGMVALGEARGLVAWCWGINGMFGVAGSAVAIYIAIYQGLKIAFLFGIVCYLMASFVYLFGIVRTRILPVSL